MTAYRREDPRGKIDSIPFIGVVVVPLLISLLVIPGFTPPSRAPLVTLPTGSKEQRPVNADYFSILDLTITRDGRFWLDDGSELIRGAMEREVRSDPYAHVRVRADQDVPFGSVRRAMREIRQGGRKGLSLVVRDRGLR